MKVDEFPVFPDTRTEVKFERDPTALFVVGVALFRNPKGRNWWTEFELPPPPGKGDCMFPDPKCSGPDCQKEAGGPPLDAALRLWIDGSRIDDGADHLDEYPEATRIRQLYLRCTPRAGTPSPGGATPPAAAPPSTPATPQAPAPPSTPATPPLPGAPQ